MNLRHTFNRHQEQFMYFFAALFVAVVAAFYFWAISAITGAIMASYNTGTPPPSPTRFDLAPAKNIPVLNAPNTNQ